MALTEAFIRECADDEALFRALAEELSERIPRELEWDTEGHLARMRALRPSACGCSAAGQSPDC